MSKIFKNLVYIIFIFSFSISAQEILVHQDNSHELFVATLKNSKDIKFQEILSNYDDYILKHPNNIKVKIYRCKFIGSAYYDEFEDYNLKYDETESCIQELYESYPKDPDVILYKLENLYGEDRGAFLDETLSLYYSDKSIWSYNQASALFEIGALYFNGNNDIKSLSYAKKAERFGDSLDLSILISNIYLRQGNKIKAQESILSALYLDSEAWELNQKGNVLIEVGEYSEALKIFERVKQKDSAFINNENLYRIFLKSKNYEIARNYLVKDTINEWDKIPSLQRLVEHDTKYSDSETALESYRRLQKEDYFDDFLGIKRIRIFLSSPFKSWSFTELSHIFLLLIFILIILLIPYLWVLPVYVYGKYFKKKESKSILPFDWRLKHFWGISFLYLLSQSILVFIFYYQYYINLFFEITYAYYEETLVENEITTANSLIIFSCLLLVSTLVFLNRERIKFIFNSNFGIIKMIGFGVLFLIANGIILKILGGFIDLTEAANIIKSLSIKEEIGVLMNNYGFTASVVVIAMIVPFYEEIIFRGIILSSSEKHVGFKVANIVQALLFATVHFSLKLFIFYFIFGLVTGYIVKRSNGLLMGIIFHAINNFFVLLAIYMLTF